MVRNVSIRDAAPEKRSPSFGQYALVIEADGVPHTFLYTVEFLPDGFRSIQWAPAQSFLANPAVPVMVVASIADTVVQYHWGEAVSLPLAVMPHDPGPDTVVVRLYSRQVAAAW